MVIAAECGCWYLRSALHFGDMQRQFIDKAALRMVACPVCHAALTAPHPEALLCTGCGRRYPIRDGLPVLLAAAAERP
jgi:uncharacterized protein YbaR (Trm112 family)